MNKKAVQQETWNEGEVSPYTKNLDSWKGKVHLHHEIWHFNPNFKAKEKEEEKEVPGSGEKIKVDIVS